MIVQKSLVDMACEEVKRLIANGSLAAGERVLEAPLSQQLGISRPPLREALRIMAAQHILELTPRRGYRVAGLTSEDADEIYSLRTVLERFALDLLFERIQEVDFDVLRATMDAMWAAARVEDERGVISANRDFHVAFVDLADHRRLSQSYATLMEQMVLYMTRNISYEARTNGDLREGCRRHEHLLEALQSRDRERIEEAVRVHGERRYLEPEGIVR